ncbi:MAG: WYL domain-containing protein [Deltaproteobacteria bacterium]|nr:WYL domain-containing protein [Deltaproteobacteria bacterium]
MKRVDRVVDLQALLRARESATVQELARDLRVSERTVLRDLATLRGHGVPIESQSGPGGGIRLERDRGIVAVHFAINELIALWLAATLSASATSLPWNDAAKRGLHKVLASLPKERARALRALVKRVVVGRPASPRIYADLGKMAPELLSAVEECFTRGLCLAFDYVDRRGTPTKRTVEPHGLLVETPAWYLLCRDVEKTAVRMFRIDRIRQARVLSDRPFLPDVEAVFREWKVQQAVSSPPNGGDPRSSDSLPPGRRRS